MVAGNLGRWLDGERDRLVWIEYDDYAHRVFAGGAADWLDVPTVFAGGIGQAQGVVATEVLSIDVLAPYFAKLDQADGTPSEAVQAMLQLDAPQRFIVEVIDALAHSLAARVDLVVKVPAPAQLLRRAGLQDEPSFDELDDVGIALSNVVREFSTKPIAGVLIAGSAALSADEAEAIESIVSAARHYEWRVALSLDDLSAVPEETPEVDADLLLLPGIRLADLGAAAELPLAVGGGLGAGYWQAPGETPASHKRSLLYGAIPLDTQPELVVQRVADAFA